MLVLLPDYAELQPLTSISDWTCGTFGDPGARTDRRTGAA